MKIKAEKHANNVNIIFLLMVVSALLVPLIMGPLFTGLDIYQSAAISEIIFLVPTLAVAWLRDKELLARVPYGWLPFPVLVLSILAGVTLVPVASFLNAVSMIFVQNHLSETVTVELAGSFQMNIIYLAFLPALMEEFMFRGVFYHGYRRAGVWKAALLSALCFGLIHMNWNQFLYAFVLGFVFALITEAAGNFLAGSAAHFVINFTSVFALELEAALETAAPAASAGAASAAEAMLTSEEISQLLRILTLPALTGVGLTALLIWRIADHCGRKDFLKPSFAAAAGETERGYRGRTETAAQTQNEEVTLRPAETVSGSLYGQTGGAGPAADPERTAGQGTADPGQDLFEEGAEAEETGKGRGLISWPLPVGIVLAAAYMIWLG